MQRNINIYHPPTEVIPAVAVNATSQDRAAWTLKEKILFSLLGVVVVGGTVFLAQRVIKNAISGKEENKSFEEGTSATFAKQIKMAFENDGWPGTNTISLRNTLREVPSKEEFSKVAKSYQRLYNGNLIKEMSDELQSTEYNEMLQILAAKPEKTGEEPSSQAYGSWAKRMRAAFDKAYGFFSGTDGEAIVAVFNEIPSQGVFLKVCQEYQSLYGTNMLEDLKSESEFGQYEEWMSIVTAKPN